MNLSRSRGMGGCYDSVIVTIRGCRPAAHPRACNPATSNRSNRLRLSAVVEDLGMAKNDRERKREGKTTRARGRKPLSSRLHRSQFASDGISNVRTFHAGLLIRIWTRGRRRSRTLSIWSLSL